MTLHSSIKEMTSPATTNQCFHRVDLLQEPRPVAAALAQSVLSEIRISNEKDAIMHLRYALCALARKQSTIEKLHDPLRV